MPTTVKDHQAHKQQWSTASRLQIQIQLTGPAGRRTTNKRVLNYCECLCTGFQSTSTNLTDSPAPKATSQVRAGKT